MKISDETKILDIEFRKHVLKEIDGSENLARKDDALRRFDVFKDYIKYYMNQILEKELEPETISEMQSRTSPINILKKIVTKKARVYKNGVKRTFSKDQKAQDSIEDIYKYIRANMGFKKANRFLELIKNTIIFISPKEHDGGKWSYCMRPKFTHMYDVIEDARDPEKPLVFIFSPHTRRHQVHDLKIAEGRSVGAQQTNFRSGDGKDQSIADAPIDDGDDIKDTREFVWWSNSYHFTTNAKGEIIESKTPEGGLNPIGQMPIVSLHKDQDGSYWAMGGEDLIEGTLLINVLLTDMYFIAKLNGFGQFYFFGKNPPKSIKIGPNRGIIHDVQPDDPIPQAGFMTSNPPLADLRTNIEQAVALLLTTNDLSTSQVSGSLDGTNPASGIADLISRSDVTGAIEDDQQIFIDAEEDVFDLIRLWHNYYFDKKLLIDKLQKLGKVPKESEISIQYPPVTDFSSEESRITTIVTKLEAKLITRLRAVKDANPGMSEEDAIEELKKITLEQLERQAQMMQNDIKDAVSNPEEPEEEDESEEEKEIDGKDTGEVDKESED